MRKIGLEYDGLKSIGKSSSIRNIGTQHALRWGKMTNDELMDLIIEMRVKKLYTITEYNQGKRQEKHAVDSDCHQVSWWLEKRQE